MTKSKILDRLLDISDEEREASKQRRLEERAKLTLAYQLGYYVGEQIVRRHLPTLSCDSITTNKVIQVRISEADELKRLNDIWFALAHNTTDSTSDTEEWKALRAYHVMLEEKYLPKTIECNFMLLNVTEENMVDFKKGISHSLWNCDCSHYSVDEDKIDVKADDTGMFTVITLTKD